MGYDFGATRLKTNTNSSTFIINSKWNTFHKSNLIIENRFKKNILFSLGVGLDYHNVYFESELLSGGDEETIITKNFHNAIVKTNRIGLSFGYLYELNAKNSFVFKFNIENFVLSGLRLLQSEQNREEYDVSSDQIDYSTPILSSTKQVDLVSYSSFGYPNKFNIANLNFSISLEYRWSFSFLMINVFTAYSPKYETFIQKSENNSAFITGIRIGYEIPLSKEKTKQHE
jgi:hypothetical protein